MIRFDKKIYSLRELLTSPQELPSDGVSIFIEDGIELAGDSKCAVLTDDDYDESGEDFRTAFISDMTMSDFLSVDAFEQVVNNTHLQRDCVSLEMLLAAVAFYFENDAFIDFDSIEV